MTDFEMRELSKTPDLALCKKIGDDCLLEKYNPSIGICFRCRMKHFKKERLRVLDFQVHSILADSSAYATQKRGEFSNEYNRIKKMKLSEFK